jgi:lipid-binding SYLF domain-containing protein
MCWIFVAAGLAAGLPACSTEPKQESDKRALAEDSRGALDHFKAQDPTLQGLLDKSAGYALFPDVGKGGLIVGGSYGHGEVFQAGTMIGYASISQGTVGLQAGGEEFSELIVFNTKDALERFKRGETTFAANASAVAIKAGAAATARDREGVTVFTHAKGGLMAEAAIGGQKFSFQPL